jgi:hypothetical protein
MIKEINKEIDSRPLEHNISGQIPLNFLEDLSKKTETELEKWKIFFLSFLHNSGRNKDFANHSPFMSLTYGCKKYVIGRKFALKRSKMDKGFLYLYYLKKDWPYFLKAIDFKKILNKFEVKWYKDVNSEIILINGMYPHYLLGIFEVEPYKNPRFILNPWLNYIFSRDQKLNLNQGIKVDQTHFVDFAQKMGYRSYFFHSVDNEQEYVSQLNDPALKVQGFG